MELQSIEEFEDSENQHYRTADITRRIFKKKVSDSVSPKRNDRSREEILPLECYVLENKTWRHVKFEGEWETIKIGSGSFEADLVLENEPDIDDIQVILQYTAGQWFVIERGKNDLTVINGIKKRHAALRSDTACILNIGNTPIILITGGRTDLTQTNLEIKKFYTIRTDAGELNWPFNKTVLIGANPACNICIDGHDFAAAITSYGNRLYLYAPFESDIKADGKDIEGPTALSSHSRIKIEGYEMNIKINPPENPSEGYFIIPETVNSRPVLLELKPDSTIGRKLIMPSAGSSIFLGRDKTNYFVIDNKQISRQHAQLITYKNRLLVIDSGSTNGVHVNGSKVSRRMAFPGDIIEFGTVRFIFSYSSE